VDIQHITTEHQRALKQRNMLLITTIGASLLGIVGLLAAVSQREQLVLQPVLRTPLVLSSASLSREYLEAVTRDAALLMFNRTPQGLDYWMESVLAITHPSAYDRVKADMLKIVSEQRGSSISQFITMSELTVDPEARTSEVRGTLHTIVAGRELNPAERTFRFGWDYTGIELKLVSFEMLTPVEKRVTRVAGVASTK
jgi:conjugal transfer pilus assembly protein TraE